MVVTLTVTMVVVLSVTMVTMYTVTMVTYILWLLLWLHRNKLSHYEIDSARIFCLFVLFNVPDNNISMFLSTSQHIA